MSIDHNNDPFWKAYTPLNDKLTKDGKKAPKLIAENPGHEVTFKVQ